MQNTFENDTGMLRIGLDPIERRNYQNQEAEINKSISNFRRQARENAKPKTCCICHQPCSSFCNSHSIPQFCLKRIAVGGKLYPSIWNSGLPLFDREMGIKEAGTFQLICRSCDSKEFQEYEAAEVYSSVPNGQVLAQICMKDYLQMISKRKQEIELYKLEAEKAPYPWEMQHYIEIAELDLHEYQLGFERAYKAAHGNHDDWYYLCYFQKLDYTVPFAFQGLIILACDLNGEVINDMFNMSPNYREEEIHVAVFPLATESIVMMIIDSRWKRYRKFYRQLKRLPLEDQLAAINYMIFAYSENVFISKEISKDILSNDAFLRTCQMTNVVAAPSPITHGQSLNTALKAYDFSQRNEIPNLLSKRYALSNREN